MSHRKERGDLCARLGDERNERRKITCSAFTTSIITPPFSIWASPALTVKSFFVDVDVDVGTTVEVAASVPLVMETVSLIAILAKFTLLFLLFKPTSEIQKRTRGYILYLR